MKQVLVIGGGPAGLTAAAVAARAGAAVTLWERGAVCGAKLRLTGKGRCNVTNNIADPREIVAQIPGNGRFLHSAFSRFSPADTMAFFESLGVPLKTERGGRVFPVSDKARDVADALIKYAENSGVRIVTGRRADQIPAEGAVVIATGGVSYPQTGSTGDGYALAKMAGHSIVTPMPSLVPLVCAESFCRDLMGLTLKNTALTVMDTARGKTIFEAQGELLFTHFGVSGPLILSASAHMRPFAPRRFSLMLDLKPARSPAQLEERCLREFEGNENRFFSNICGRLLPRVLIPVLLKHCQIAPETKVCDLTRPQRQRFTEVLKRFPLTVTAMRPLEEAVVTAGGVDLRQVNPKTMESKLRPGLFFAGEVLDVDAYTGGFNLQIAFSTGFLAGTATAAAL